MKILITGHSGFIGKKLLFWLGGKHDVSCLKGDIRDDLPTKHYDLIFHLAAVLTESKDEAFSVNAEATLKLAAHYPNSRVIFASSCAADNLDSFYGITKRVGELALIFHKNWLNVRIFNPYGPGQTLESGAIIPRIMDAKLKKTSVSVNGDGTQRRDFVYIDDVIKWLIEFGKSDITGTIDLGSGESVSINELINMIIENPIIEYRPKSFGLKDSVSEYSLPGIIPLSTGLKFTEEWWRNE